MKKQAKVEVISANTEPELSPETKKKVQELSEKLSALQEKVNSGKYLVEGKKHAAQNLKTFLTERANWKFTEALGVIEAIRQVTEAEKNIAAGTVSELLLDNLALEAIYYFLSKEEGKGQESAVFYHDNLLKPIVDALGRAKTDKDAANELATQIAILEEGLEPQNTPAENVPATA